MAALREALAELAGAMELREDRFAPGEALAERSYGDLRGWLENGDRHLRSAHDIVRFNQLERCAVYCNFVGADLDLRRSGARGVEALKTFLEYAETGLIDVAEITGREADSPFEQAVADRLRARGFDVEHQVGSAGFFVDLAVADPERPGREGALLRVAGGEGRG